MDSDASGRGSEEQVRSRSGLCVLVLQHFMGQNPPPSMSQQRCANDGAAALSLPVCSFLQGCWMRKVQGTSESLRVLKTQAAPRPYVHSRLDPTDHDLNKDGRCASTSSNTPTTQKPDVHFSLDQISSANMEWAGLIDCSQPPPGHPDVLACVHAGSLNSPLHRL